MTKQLMIYGRAVPISSEAHRDWSVRLGGNYGFARDVNSVPVLAAEFTAAAQDYPIVFAGDENNVLPAVMLGMHDAENGFVGAEGEWMGGYVPAFLRRYPFVFSRSDDGDTFTLCIDEEFDGFNQENRGERLFDADGKRTQFLQNILTFATEYQAQFDRTQQFCQRLVEHKLLTRVQVQFSLPGGERSAIDGVYAINRDALKALPADVLAEMMQTDELELCYVHMQSLNNLTPMARKIAGRATGEKAA